MTAFLRRTCAHCGAEFLAERCRVAGRPRAGLWCSSACSNASRRTWSADQDAALLALLDIASAQLGVSRTAIVTRCRTLHSMGGRA